MAYRTRPVRYLRQWTHETWRLKTYGISASGERPPDELGVAGERLASKTLPAAATAHGVGFLGLHAGANAWFVFVAWWAKIYELNLFLFRGPQDRPNELEPVERGVIGCTWDLRVISFERDAWVSSMLGGDGPNLDMYLAATFNADV